MTSHSLSANGQVQALEGFDIGLVCVEEIPTKHLKSTVMGCVICCE